MLSNRTITRQEFRDLIAPWLEAIGATLSTVKSMELDPDGIRVTVFRQRDDGGRIIIRNRYVEDVYYIAVHGDSPVESVYTADEVRKLEDGDK